MGALYHTIDTTNTVFTVSVYSLIIVFVASQFYPPSFTLWVPKSRRARRRGQDGLRREVRDIPPLSPSIPPLIPGGSPPTRDEARAGSHLRPSFPEADSNGLCAVG